jgi:hypothetical protein
VTLIYPGIGGRPIIAAAIRCLLSDRGYFVNMLLDTGAQETCFPAAYAHQFGHDNAHPNVEVRRNAVQGVGGASDAFLHSIQISLLDPIKTRERKPVIAWTSPPVAQSRSFLRNKQTAQTMVKTKSTPRCTTPMPSSDS